MASVFRLKQNEFLVAEQNKTPLYKNGRYQLNRRAFHVCGARRERTVADRATDARRIEGRQGSRRWLGNPNLADVRNRAVASTKAEADALLRTLPRVSVNFSRAGVASHRGIARSLNARGVAT